MLGLVLKEFAAKHPGILVANLGMMAFTPISDIYLPHLYGLLVNKIEKGQDIKVLTHYTFELGHRCVVHHVCSCGDEHDAK